MRTWTESFNITLRNKDYIHYCYYICVYENVYKELTSPSAHCIRVHFELLIPECIYTTRAR